MKRTFSKDYLNKVFSNEIQGLLDKKMFSKSKYFYSTRKLPSNRVKIMPLEFTRRFSIVKTYLLCALLLIVYFINIFKFKSGDRGKNLILIYSLTKEQAIRNGTTESLRVFLDSKGILSDSDSLTLIEIRGLIRCKRYKTLRTTLDIPLSIFSSKLSIRKRLTCWLSMFKRFYIIIKVQNKNRQAVLIFKEYIFDEIVYSALDENCIEKLITTQSHVAFQPLIFEFRDLVGKRYMVWYSSNSIPIKYKEIKFKRFQINPAIYENMCIDEHWVWTKQHKEYLGKYSQARIIVKKSMMFYESEISKDLNNIYDIVIFDVTPHNDMKITNNSVYTTNEMVAFITEILDSITKLNFKHGTKFRVYLKHKRKISKNHSSYYSDFVSTKVKSKEIDRLDHDQNLYDVIKRSKLVIGFPFTSPVVIGSELNKPAIFYCSSKLLIPSRKSQTPLFLQSKKSLYAYLEKKLVVVK
jgi:polysaccharide biosynthesis PFTS motif protein